jgi:hypothetical protein
LNVHTGVNATLVPDAVAHVAEDVKIVTVLGTNILIKPELEIGSSVVI